MAEAVAAPARVPVQMTVNGTEYAAEVEPRLLLVHFLRDNLGLTGTHVGCDTSQCGACVVYLDGRSGQVCTVLAVQADGGEMMTIEGLAKDGELHPVQEGFWEMHGLQCGFCTPGMIMSALRAAASESRIRPKRRFATASKATSAAAPATRTSSRPCSTPPHR